jgi:hypothetical protein
MKLRHIGAQRQVDADERRICLFVIVVFQPPPYLPCLDSYHPVIPSRVASGALKELHSNASFLQKASVSLKGLVNDVGKELLRTLAPPKALAI